MILNVKVKPNSRESKIEKINDVDYIVFVKNPPKDGKANEEVVKLLAKHFNVSYKQISVKKPSSRKKIIEIN